MLYTKFLSKNTVDSYMNDISIFKRFYNDYTSENLDLDKFLKLDKNIIRSWFLYRKNNHDTSKTISRGLSALKNLLLFLIDINLIKDSEIIHMRSPKIEKTLPRPLNIDDINNIIDSISDIKQTPWIIKRDKSLLILIYSVGLRLSESLSINYLDFINSQNGFLEIIGKGMKYRNVPILKPVYNIVLDYIKLCPFFKNPNKNTPLFMNKNGERLGSSSVQKIIKKSRELLNMSESVTPHAFRHSFATHVMEKSGDLRSIQEILGHSSISSTQIYTEVSSRHLSEIYDKCHPLSDDNKKDSC